MTRVIRHWMPGGTPWATVEVLCDECGAPTPGGALGTDNPAEVGQLRARIRLAARLDRWAALTVLVDVDEAGELISHRIDLCPRCRSPRGAKQRPWK